MLSKQYLTMELCRRNRVLFVDPVIHVGSVLRPQPTGRAIAYHAHQPANLRIVRPWWLPKTDKSPTLRRAADGFYLWQLRHLGFRPDCVITFNPEYPYLGRELGCPMVYYPVDAMHENGREPEMVAQADLVVAATRTLYQRFLGRARRLEFLPHGISPDAFTVRAGEMPADLAALPRPVAGFIGSVGTFLDLNLLESFARARPAVTVALVGPYRHGEFGGGLSDEELARLQSAPNVHLLGTKTTRDLPTYIAGFDIGLIPYNVRHARVHFSYHKVLQYLIMGKPVVTTLAAPPDLAPPCYYLGETPQAFVEAATRALTEHDAARAEQAVAFAREHTWARRAEQLERWLEELG